MWGYGDRQRLTTCHTQVGRACAVMGKLDRAIMHWSMAFLLWHIMKCNNMVEAESGVVWDIPEAAESMNKFGCVSRDFLRDPTGTKGVVTHTREAHGGMVEVKSIVYRRQAARPCHRHQHDAPPRLAYGAGPCMLLARIHHYLSGCNPLQRCKKVGQW
jgi:hypothetical protein